MAKMHYLVLEQGEVVVDLVTGSDEDIIRRAQGRLRNAQQASRALLSEYLERGHTAPFEFPRLVLWIAALPDIRDDYLRETQTLRCSGVPGYPELEAWWWDTSLWGALEWLAGPARLWEDPGVRAYYETIDQIVLEHFPLTHRVWRERLAGVLLMDAHIEELKKHLKGRIISASLAKRILKGGESLAGPV